MFKRLSSFIRLNADDLQLCAGLALGVGYVVYLAAFLLSHA